MKGLLKLPNVHMLLKQELITSQKPGDQDFWQIDNVLSKGKSAVPTLFNGLEVLPSASDNAKLLTKNFSSNSNLGESGTS